MKNLQTESTPRTTHKVCIKKVISHIVSLLFKSDKEEAILEHDHQRALAEEEKRRIELELEQIKEVERLKSAFISHISHEIRTPLNSIVGFSSIIAGTEDPDERKEYLHIVEKNNYLLLQLFSDIIDFSNIEAGTFEYQFSQTNIPHLCQDVCHRFNSYPISDVSLLFHREKHPEITIHTDGKRVKQVLSNLISNAYKFTDKGHIDL